MFLKKDDPTGSPFLFPPSAAEGYRLDNARITKSMSLFSNSWMIWRYVFCVVVKLECPKRPCDKKPPRPKPHRRSGFCETNDPRRARSAPTPRRELNTVHNYLPKIKSAILSPAATVASSISFLHQYGLVSFIYFFYQIRSDSSILFAIISVLFPLFHLMHFYRQYRGIIYHFSSHRKYSW